VFLILRKDTTESICHRVCMSNKNHLSFRCICFQAMGIGDNGTWRWKFLPLEVDMGGNAELVSCRSS